MTRPPVVLTVCLGNICRSPTAAAAITEAADHLDVEVEVRSAGTGSWHLGSPPDARMVRAAADEGLDLTGVAEQVDAAAMADADLVLAMDRDNLAHLEVIAEHEGVTTPIRLFRAFDPESLDDLEVPDPYYGGDEGFVAVVALARRAARGVVAAVADGLPAEEGDAGAPGRGDGGGGTGPA